MYVSRLLTIHINRPIYHSAIDERRKKQTIFIEKLKTPVGMKIEWFLVSTTHRLAIISPICQLNSFKNWETKKKRSENVAFISNICAFVHADCANWGRNAKDRCSNGKWAGERNSCVCRRPSKVIRRATEFHVCCTRIELSPPYNVINIVVLHIKFVYVIFFLF